MTDPERLLAEAREMLSEKPIDTLRRVLEQVPGNRRLMLALEAVEEQVAALGRERDEARAALGAYISPPEAP